jgi:hypothetical protein
LGVVYIVDTKEKRKMVDDVLKVPIETQDWICERGRPDALRGAVKSAAVTALLRSKIRALGQLTTPRPNY